jgi:hypothetical protein
MAMLRPAATVRRLSELVGDSGAAADVRLRRALLLAMLGNSAGEDVLLEALKAGWDEGWNYTGMGQFGRSLSPLDDVVVALGRIGGVRAKNLVADKVAQLDANAAFSHFRAVALYAESVGGDDLARALAALLAKPGVGGHAWLRLEDELAAIPVSHIDTTTRNASLRELYLARALFRIGDADGVGQATLQRYARDIRGHYAQHASLVLAAGPAAAVCKKECEP